VISFFNIILSEFVRRHVSITSERLRRLPLLLEAAVRSVIESSSLVLSPDLFVPVLVWVREYAAGVRVLVMVMQTISCFPLCCVVLFTEIYVYVEVRR
jgi:hypothetical protein